MEAFFWGTVTVGAAALALRPDSRRAKPHALEKFKSCDGVSERLNR